MLTSVVAQSCCAVERVYVHKDVYDEFVKGAVETAQSYKLGDPKSDSTGMGPIAQAKHPKLLSERVCCCSSLIGCSMSPMSQVNEAIKAGATLLTGGKETKDSNGKGRFFAPTVLANVNHTMKVRSFPLSSSLSALINLCWLDHDRGDFWSCPSYHEG